MMNPSMETSLIDTQDYQRIAKAIAFMRQNILNQPDLATIAQYVHLSEYHFQRMFTRWAGISPKRFLQYLTVEYAKAKIAQTQNLLELSADVGLSSPGRLHDLFVKLEAMSPGEFKAGGANLQIYYGIHATPFGHSLIATTSRGVCHLQFLDVIDKETIEKMLHLTWPNAEIICHPTVTQEICDRLFYPVTINSKPFVVLVKGTNFQIQVWRALLRIPFGSLTTYQTLAKMIGNPTAARAVGNAVGSNPIAFLIPCHRVIRESGDLGGYRWERERKMTMLDWEACRNLV